VLEGGQTKEEKSVMKSFSDETLAEDEINRLLAPKVLTSFVRCTAKGSCRPRSSGRRERGQFGDENLIIKRYNLLALHVLKTQYPAYGQSDLHRPAV